MEKAKKIKVLTKVTSQLEKQLGKMRNRESAFKLLALAFFSLIPILGYYDLNKLDSKKPDTDMTYGKFLGNFTLWCAGLMFAVTFGTGFLGLGEDEKGHIKNLVSRVMDDKKLADKLNLELVKISPVLKSVAQYVSGSTALYVDKKGTVIGTVGNVVGEKILKGEINDEDAKIVAGYIDKYLRSHPKDAAKFLVVLDAAQLSQDVVDKYILEYVPNTASFNIAREIQEGRRILKR